MDEQQFLESVGKRIRDARTQLDLSQEQLAERVGKTQNTISAYETGSRAMRIVEIPLFAEALNVSIGYLLGEIQANDEYFHRLYRELRTPFNEWIIQDMKRLIRLQENPSLRRPRSQRPGTPRRFSMAGTGSLPIPKAEQTAYDIYVYARAMFEKEATEKVQEDLPIDRFILKIQELAAKYTDNEISMKTFATLMGIDVAPLEDILRNLDYEI